MGTVSGAAGPQFLRPLCSHFPPLGSLLLPHIPMPRMEDSGRTQAATFPLPRTVSPSDGERRGRETCPVTQDTQLLLYLPEAAPGPQRKVWVKASASYLQVCVSVCAEVSASPSMNDDTKRTKVSCPPSRNLMAFLSKVPQDPRSETPRYQGPMGRCSGANSEGVKWWVRRARRRWGRRGLRGAWVLPRHDLEPSEAGGSCGSSPGLPT